MKEVKILVDEVNVKEEKKRTIIKKSFEKKVNIPCYLHNDNTKFISQKRFYSIVENEDDMVPFMDKHFLDGINKYRVDIGEDIVAVFFLYQLRKFNFYQLGKTTSEFGSTIMEGKQLMIINDKFIFIVSEERQYYYYQVNLLIKGEIELEEKFKNIYDFIVLNLQFLSESDLKICKSLKYEIININNMNEIFFKVFFLDRFNLEFFETMAKYKYEDVTVDFEYFLIIFKNVKNITNFITKEVFINKIIFLDDFIILVYNKCIFVLDYIKEFDEFAYTKKDLVSYLIPYILFKNGVYLNAYLSEK